jgi:hypothetical protein
MNSGKRALGRTTQPQLSKELEDKELVKTGPIDIRASEPGSALVFVLPYSKREYVYLTTKGYKATREDIAGMLHDEAKSGGYLIFGFRKL